MSGFAEVGGSFLREQIRAPLNLVLLFAIPIFFVLIFAEVLGEFAAALGGDLAEQAATSISAGWAAAFLCGTLAFFQLNSSREADRRLAAAGLGPWRVATSRIAAAVVLGVIVSVVAYLTLWLGSGIEHPPHAALAIFMFAAIYIGIGALIGVLVRDPLSGSLLIVLVFSLDVFSGPSMTNSGSFATTPTRDAADLLIAAGLGQGSPASDWIGAAAVAVTGIAVALLAFWLSARSRS
ncbi:MAG: hypothetical protein ACRDK5_09400 [Solirubrobacterales bacterium]